jgi:hypothetical protein
MVFAGRFLIKNKIQFFGSEPLLVTVYYQLYKLNDNRMTYMVIYGSRDIFEQITEPYNGEVEGIQQHRIDNKKGFQKSLSTL